MLNKKALIELVKPHYDRNDLAHGMDHGLYIADECERIANTLLDTGKKFTHKESDVVTIAWCSGLFHDIYARYRDNHHIMGSEFVMKNQSTLVKYGVNPLLVADISLGVLAHRASTARVMKPGIYALIVAAADNSQVLDLDKAYNRAITYRLSKGDIEDDAKADAAAHIKEKFGRGSTWWVPNEVWKAAYDPTGEKLEQFYIEIEKRFK